MNCRFAPKKKNTKSHVAVHYQSGERDEFHHKYKYDADSWGEKREMHVRTTTFKANFFGGIIFK